MNVDEFKKTLKSTSTLLEDRHFYNASGGFCSNTLSRPSDTALRVKLTGDTLKHLHQISTKYKNFYDFFKVTPSRGLILDGCNFNASDQSKLGLLFKKIGDARDVLLGFENYSFQGFEFTAIENAINSERLFLQLKLKDTIDQPSIRVIEDGLARIALRVKVLVIVGVTKSRFPQIAKLCRLYVHAHFEIGEENMKQQSSSFIPSQSSVLGRYDRNITIHYGYNFQGEPEFVATKHDFNNALTSSESLEYAKVFFKRYRLNIDQELHLPINEIREHITLHAPSDVKEDQSGEDEKTSFSNLNDVENFRLHEDEVSIEKLIDGGAYADIFKGKYLDQDAALKKCKYVELNETTRNELNIMRRLRGDHFPLLYGFFETSESLPKLVLVMKYMKNGSLCKAIRDDRLNGALRYKISTQVSGALLHLHAHNILHRDLKSANVLLDENWDAKLSDFGLSILCKSDKGAVNDGLAGTLYWLAPEIFRGENFSKQSDIYSLAVIFWEMAARKLPYADVNGRYDAIQKIEIQKMKMAERLEKPQGCPDDLYDLMLSCWQLLPNERLNAKQVFDKLSTLKKCFSDNKSAFFRPDADKKMGLSDSMLVDSVDPLLGCK